MPLPSNFVQSDKVQKSHLIDNAFQFPPNLAQTIHPTQLNKIFAFIQKQYIEPQVRDRRIFEEKWDELLKMYKISAEVKKLHLPKTEKTEDLIHEMMKMMASTGQTSEKSQVSDSLIFDAVDRLKNLNYFISWKDGTPAQFNLPKNKTLLQDEYYHPLTNKIESSNGLVDWSIKQEDVRQRHLKANQHYYLYGIVFIHSDYQIELRLTKHRQTNGQIVERYDIEKAGVSFNPLSCRKVWIDYRIPLDEMWRQPCPFFFRDAYAFEVRQNIYDPTNNPFGFANSQNISPTASGTYSQEMDSYRKGLSNNDTAAADPGRGAVWTFYPFLPLDPITGILDEDGRLGTKWKRFTYECYGTTLTSPVTHLRLQEWYHPGQDLPIYGASHIPDLDSGAYTPSIADLLQNHYYELCTCMNQLIDNKNWINNPPSWCMVGSPAAKENRNLPGANLEVVGQNDFGWRQPYDATQTTQGMLEHIRDQGQTTSKSVDAILGKAMGARTTATEASNAFQSAMSGVTTDIDSYNDAIMGGFIRRVWKYCGLWMDTDLLAAITGQYGEPLTPEDMWIMADVVTNVGSTFVESVVKAQHLRYTLEAGIHSPNLRQDILWKALFKELRLTEAMPAVMDNGFERQITIATEQAISIYMGRDTIIDPSQDHQSAIEVKTRFLQDHQSPWNKEYAALPSRVPNPQTGQSMTRSQELAYHIQIHQMFLQMQMLQQQAQQREQQAMIALGELPAEAALPQQ